MWARGSQCDRALKTCLEKTGEENMRSDHTEPPWFFATIFQHGCVLLNVCFNASVLCRCVCGSHHHLYLLLSQFIIHCWAIFWSPGHFLPKPWASVFVSDYKWSQCPLQAQWRFCSIKMVCVVISYSYFHSDHTSVNTQIHNMYMIYIICYTFRCYMFELLGLLVIPETKCLMQQPTFFTIRIILWQN